MALCGMGCPPLQSPKEGDEPKDPPPARQLPAHLLRGTHRPAPLPRTSATGLFWEYRGATDPRLTPLSELPCSN